MKNCCHYLLFNLILSLNLLAQFPPVDTLRTSKVISFDLPLIDTTQFENRFNMIGEIPIYGRSSELLLFDSNKNGKDEIIGIFWDSDAPITGITQFYELDDSNITFEQVYSFGTEIVNAGGVQRFGGDLNSDGNPELYLQYGDSLRVYTSVDSSYATQLKEVVYPVLPVSPASFETADFDGDSLQELIHFRNFTPNDPQIAVLREFNLQDSTLAITQEVIIPGYSGGGFLAIQDFDKDCQNPDSP